MPPKRAPPRGRGAGQKKKGKKDKGKKKGPPKNLKKLKKFANIVFEDEYIWDKSRGELEVIAMTLQRQVEKDRADRIRMAYERDFLFDMTQVYLQKIRDVRMKVDKMFHETSDLSLDAEEAHLHTRLTQKQAVYGFAMGLSAIDMKTRKRLNKYKKMIKQKYQFVRMDDKYLDELIASLPAQREERLRQKAESLEPLSERLGVLKEQGDSMIEMLLNRIRSMIKERMTIVHSELALEFDYACKDLYATHVRCNLVMSLIKDFYYDITHNLLNLIFLDMDYWEDMDADAVWTISHRKLYDIANGYLAPVLASMIQPFVKFTKKVFLHGKAVHALDFTYRLLRTSEHKLEDELNNYKKMSKKFEVYDNKLDIYEIPFKEIMHEICDSITSTYQTDEFEATYRKKLDRYVTKKNEFIEAWGSEAVQCYWIWREAVGDGVERLMDAKLREYRSYKLFDDTYTSVRARADTLGFHRRRHPIKHLFEDRHSGKHVFLMGRQHGMSSIPMTQAIIAKEGFPLPTTDPIFKISYPDCQDDDEGVYSDRDMFFLYLYAFNHEIKYL